MNVNKSPETTLFILLNISKILFAQMFNKAKVILSRKESRDRTGIKLIVLLLIWDNLITEADVT